MKPALRLVYGLVALALISGCGNGEDRSENHSLRPAIDTTTYPLTIPSHFPSMVIPEGNPLTKAKVGLGQRLFFDPALSGDSSVSCASCHHPGKAFSDTVALSAAAYQRHTERNSPALMNVGFHPVLMREGAVPTLELQVLSPLEGETEMAHNIVAACERLNQDTAYRRLFLTAFGDSVTPFTLTRAIAAFERTLIGGNSKYDRYLLGDSNALSATEKHGLELFNSADLACTSCHSGVLLTNFSIENNGLYDTYEDQGLYRLTLDEGDKGKFKVPTLRNIALTAPYMHDGSLESLDLVIDHYAKGGAGHSNQASEVDGFVLSQPDRAALIAFFDALTEE